MNFLGVFVCLLPRLDRGDVWYVGGFSEGGEALRTSDWGGSLRPGGATTCLEPDSEIQRKKQMRKKRLMEFSRDAATSVLWRLTRYGPKVG